MIVEHVQNGLRVGALENLYLEETTIRNFHLVHFTILLFAIFSHHEFPVESNVLWKVLKS